MKILFLTLVDFSSYSEHNIYCDLLREFIKHCHEVYCISPTEKRNNVDTHLEENNHLLKLKIGNTQKTNILEKGISTLLIETQFKKAIKKYFSNIKFDLILYSTPPITLISAIEYVKKRDNARTYLMLKDIFPQNAVDLEILSTKGLKGFIYRYFRRKEKKLYAISDRIGCMSPANVDYVLKHNPEIDPSIVEVCPNAIEVQDINLTDEEKKELRKKYNLPLDKKIFVYGGNLGKPQGIPFIIECLRTEMNDDKAFFLIVGDGAEYNKLEEFVNKEKPKNVLLMKSLPKEEYDRLIASCDVGLIFLDYRFTIPNFPSRLLSYLQAGLPVLACTDSNTDLGKIIVDNKFGWWCESNDVDSFCDTIEKIINCNIKEQILNLNVNINMYSIKNAYRIIENYYKGL